MKITIIKSRKIRGILGEILILMGVSALMFYTFSRAINGGNVIFYSIVSGVNLGTVIIQSMLIYRKRYK